MAPEHLKPLWLDQFTMQLGKLRSGLGPNIVADVPAAKSSSDLEPNEAAVSLSVPHWVLHGLTALP